MAAQALRSLQEVAQGPNRPVVYEAPEMVPQWQADYRKKLKQCAASALNGGVSAEKVFKLLDGIAAQDLDGLPDDFLTLCLEAGLGADTDMGGETLLHYLINMPNPIPLGVIDSSSTSSSSTKAAGKQAVMLLDVAAQDVLSRLQRTQQTAPQQSHTMCGSVTLAELLRRGAAADAPDSFGNTALHLVVACMVSKKHFPDPSVSDQHRADNMPQGEPAPGDDAVAAAGNTPSEPPQQLHDNDAARAAYAATAFVALLQAGWNPAVRNSNGYTVSDLILEGLSRYQTELSDLQDPEGVAQTTVALLSQKAPERGLQSFLNTKIAGVQAVVDALLLMHRLAAAAEAPRAARSMLSLVLLWLVLLAVTVWWTYFRK